MSILTKRDMPAGQIVYDEGGRSSALFVVQSGKVELLQEGEGGLLDTVRLVGPGEVFGELSFLAERPRDETARTVTESQLIVVERSKLDAKLTEADPFVRALYEILGRNLLSVTDIKPEDDVTKALDDLAAGLDD